MTTVSRDCTGHAGRDGGTLEVDVDLDDDDDAAVAAVRVTPRALIVAGRHWKLPARTRSYRIALTRLSPDVQLTGVRLEPGSLRVDARLPEWRMPR